jgi:hypothetical protein
METSVVGILVELLGNAANAHYQRDFLQSSSDSATLVSFTKLAQNPTFRFST